tara:strand:- start:336 stop:689 length:354 start_codon:yes stop_codon:yes gene_type:complete
MAKKKSQKKSPTPEQENVVSRSTEKHKEYCTIAKRAQEQNLPDVIAKHGNHDCTCRWDIAAETVDELMGWVTDLCDENNKLKESLQRAISRIGKGNEEMKEMISKVCPDVNSEPEKD